MILVKYESNYADEFDVEGYAVYKNKEAFEREFINYINDEDNDELSTDSLQDVLDSDIEPCVSVGSNECIDYDSVQDFYDSFTIRDISQKEADVFSKLFDGNVVGMFPF